MDSMRSFPTSCSLLVVFSLLSSNQTAAQQPAERASHPNVLMIIVDDLNDYLFTRELPVKTPNLDRFFQSAVVFEHAYCAAPVCIPSRAAVFSGMAPYRTGCYLNGARPWIRSPFTHIESLPECFKRNGYLTFGRGKIFHSHPVMSRWKAMWDNEYWGGGFGPFPPKKDQLLGKFWGCTAWTGPDTDFPDVVNANAVIEFLNQKHSKPFFAVYGLWRPHTPFTSPKRFYDLYEPQKIPIPVPGWAPGDLADIPQLGIKLTKVWGRRWELCGIRNPKRWRKFVHGYLAGSSFADWNIGRVLNALEKSRYATNTIVVLWSDNGYHCGEKNHWEKNTLWEKGARTPMAIRIPWLCSEGVRCLQPVSSLDLYPTLIDLCHLSPPRHTLDGRSLVPLLRNPETKWPYPAITTYGEGYFSARDSRYRYIRYPDGSEELYDHKTDPKEFHNLASDPNKRDLLRWFRKWIPSKFQKSMGGRLG